MSKFCPQLFAPFSPAIMEFLFNPSGRGHILDTGETSSGGNGEGGGGARNLFLLISYTKRSLFFQS